MARFIKKLAQIIFGMRYFKELTTNSKLTSQQNFSGDKSADYAGKECVSELCT